MIVNWSRYFRCIDPDVLQLSNPLEEYYIRMRDPWNIGYISSLILYKPFATKEEWESFYLEMGEYREKKISLLPTEYKSVLINKTFNSRNISSVPKELRQINYINGRTENDLLMYAQNIYKEHYQDISDLTVEKCLDALKFIIIDETWNDLLFREKNTVQALQKELLSFDISSTSNSVYREYGVGYIIKKNNREICGFHITSQQFFYDTFYCKRAQKTFNKRFQFFSEKLGIPVFTIVSTKNGALVKCKSTLAFQKFLNVKLDLHY